MKSQYSISITAQRTGAGSVVRKATTTPVFPKHIDLLRRMLPELLPMKGDEPEGTINLSASIGDDGQFVMDATVTGGAVFEGNNKARVEGMMHEGFEEMRAFEVTIEGYTPDVYGLVSRILSQPELATGIDKVQVRFMEPCKNCGGYHQDQAEMLEDVPGPLKGFVLMIGRALGLGKSNDDGLVFRVNPTTFNRSPFKMLAPERLQPIVVQAVRDGIVEAITNENETIGAENKAVLAAQTRLPQELAEANGRIDTELEARKHKLEEHAAEQRRSLEQQAEQRRTGLATKRTELTTQVGMLNTLIGTLNGAGFEFQAITLATETEPEPETEPTAATGTSDNGDIQATLGGNSHETPAAQPQPTATA